MRKYTDSIAYYHVQFEKSGKQFVAWINKKLPLNMLSFGIMCFIFGEITKRMYCLWVGCYPVSLQEPPNWRSGQLFKGWSHEFSKSPKSV